MSKTKKIILWTAVVVLFAGLLTGAYVGLDHWARLRHQQVYEQYTALQSNLEQAALTVVEGKKPVGVYTFAQLGLLEDGQAEAEICFAPQEKLTPEEFSQLPFYERLVFRPSEAERTVTIDAEDLDPVELLVDLMEMERVDAQDAFIQWQEGGYAVVPEVYGTELDYEKVYEALTAVVSLWTITPEEAEEKSFDVAACEAYLQPAVTQTAEFDCIAQLEKDAKNLVLPVKLLNETVELPVRDYVSVDETGKSTIDTKALEALVEEWTAACPQGTTDFILDSYKRGPVALDFMKVTYELDRETLLEQLTEQIGMLDAAELKAPYICKRNGEVYELGDTYVEVDIYRQKMTYFHKGEVIAYTDVVTGLPWGYWTWPGLYGVQNKDTDCQLTAPDYSVHVDYWVGYDGEYGIHDAQWREEFGGELYIQNGSHGCTNTPLKAMAAIYEKIEVGTPVIVHFVEEETEEPAENT